MSLIQEFLKKNRELKNFGEKFMSQLSLIEAEKDITDVDFGLEKEKPDLKKKIDPWAIIEQEIRKIIIHFLKLNELDIIPYICHLMIEKIFESKSRLNKNLPQLNNFCKLYLSILEKINKNKDYLSFLPLEQFDSITFDFISNKIAQGDIDSSWISINYWKQNIYDNISETEKNKKLKFKIRSMINFIEYMNEQKKRFTNQKR